MKTFITTNYDRVVESAAPRNALTPPTYRRSIFRKHDTVLKLHGTIEQPDTWVLTRAQYARHYNAELAEDLRWIFRHRTVLFLGCSLQRDLYLDVLERIPSHERGRHYAVLCVDAKDKVEARAQQLERYGISLIPYLTAGEHAFVGEFLRFLELPLEVTLKRVNDAVEIGDFDYAARTLRAWSDDAGRDVDRRMLAGVLSRAAMRLAPHIGWIAAADELSDHAVRLDPTSRDALEARQGVLERLGRDTTEICERLRRIASDSGSFYRIPQSATGLLTQTYAAYRAANVAGLSRLADTVERLYRHLDDRIAMLRLRADLQQVHPAHGLLNIETLPYAPALHPRWLAHSLAAYHAGEFASALRLLGSTGIPTDPGFVLMLKGCCEIGCTRFREAYATLRRCRARYKRPGGRLASLFKADRIPSELCYDIRRLGSDEMYALADFWLAVAEIAAEREVLTSRLNDVHARLAATSGPDRLVGAAAALMHLVIPSFGDMGHHQRFDRVVSEAERYAPGILRDLHVAGSAIVRSSLATPVLATAVARLQCSLAPSAPV